MASSHAEWRDNGWGDLAAGSSNVVVRAFKKRGIDIKALDLDGNLVTFFKWVVE